MAVEKMNEGVMHYFSGRVCCNKKVIVTLLDAIPFVSVS